jgi:hypothetical protein
MRSSVSDARSHIAALRLALLSASPGEITACIPALGEVARYLDSVSPDLHGERPGLASDLMTLQADLRRVGGLIAQGAAVSQGWAAIVGVAVSGYEPSGRPAPLTAAGSISMRG